MTGTGMGSSPDVPGRQIPLLRHCAENGVFILFWGKISQSWILGIHPQQVRAKER